MNSASFTQILSPIAHPELVFGLVAPLGVDLDLAQGILAAELREVGYDPVVIHLSKYMVNLNLGISVDNESYYTKIRSLIQIGNAFREQVGLQEACAILAISRIREERREVNESGDYETPRPRTAYIIRQLKRTEEVEALRSVYGDLFFCISYHADTTQRAKKLSQKIIFDSSNKAGTADDCLGYAHSLIIIDSNEVGSKFGQRVSETYSAADVVINSVRPDEIRSDTIRFIRLIFGDEFISPTPDEYGMYLANSAALRSRDLSRQVGAAILSKQSEIVALGCNEVPKAGGGTYWPDDKNDARDFKLGEDPSAKMKLRVIQEIIHKINQSEQINLTLFR